MITSLEAVTPEWLTHVLREPILTCIRRDNKAFNSAIAHIEVTYGAGASPDSPRHLLIKLNDQENGEAEVAFYHLVNTLLTPRLPMLVRCFSAEYEPLSGHSYCILEDLSETHSEPISREQVLSGVGVPSDVHLDRMIDALAEFHAYWWEHPQLAAMLQRFVGGIVTRKPISSTSNAVKKNGSNLLQRSAPISRQNCARCTNRRWRICPACGTAIYGSV